MTGWRVSELCADAFRNVSSLRSRATAVVLVAAGCGLLVGAHASQERVQLARTIDERVEDGWTSFRLTTSVGSLSEFDCARLRQLDVVEAAGASVSLAPIQVEPYGRSVAVEILDPSLVQPATDGQTSGPTAAIATGEVLDGISGSSPTVRVIVDGAPVVVRRYDGLLPPNLRGSIIVLGSGDRSTACNFRLDPRYADRLGPSVAAAVSRTGAEAELIRGSADGTFDASPYEAFLQRPTRLFAPGLGLVLAILAAIALRGRSNDIAVYKLVGTDSAEMALVLLVEGIICVAAFGVSAVVAVRGLNVPGAYYDSALAAGAKFVVAFWIPYLGVAVFAARRRLAILVQDR